MAIEYIIETEIAVLCLIVILCGYLRVIYSGTASAKGAFLRYCYVVAFSGMVDVALAVVEAKGDVPVWTRYACSLAWQLCANAVYFMFMRYIGSFGPDFPWKAKMRRAQTLALGVYLYLQWIGLFTGANYSVGPDGQILQGELWSILTYRSIFLWSAWTWVEMFLLRGAFTRGQWWTLWLNFLTSWIIQTLQVHYFPEIPVNFLILSVNLYVFFFLLETPAYGELERTLSRLEKAKALAEDASRVATQANVAKGEFLANMSHEIRTPLTTILGMDEVILRKAEEGPVYEYARDIQSAGNTLLHIINDILDFSKIESGQLELARRNYDLGQVLRDVDNMIRLKAEQKGLKYITQIDGTLPEQLFGDRVRVHQVMVNILNNAVKYTKRGQVKFTLTGERGIEPSNLTLHITVSDTGIGIHAEDIPKLFQSFSRIDLKETHNIEGTGLGLAITGRLIDMMGGSVDVSSTYGAGSTFHVVLPQRVVGPKTIQEFEAESTHAKKKTRRTFTAPEARVLIVDDNDMNRVVLSALMKETKVRVDQAASGEECLKKAAENAYDVILMDYMMPKMDGKETLHNMRAMENCASRDAKVVVCTANAIVGVRAELLAAGFDDFLSKPVNGKELEDILVRYIPKEKQVEPAAGS